MTPQAMLIVGMVKKKVRNGGRKLAREMECDPSDVQIRLTLNKADDTPGDYEIRYDLYWKYQLIKQNIGFLRVIGKDPDLPDVMGYQDLAEPYIAQGMIIAAEEEEIDLKDLSAFLVNHKKEYFFTIYDGAELKRHLTVKDIFESEYVKAAS